MPDVPGSATRYKGDERFPLTHLLQGIRKIMNDGAGLMEVLPEISVLLLMTGVFLGVGARLFSWDR